jgi:hypothetical protein
MQPAHSGAMICFSGASGSARSRSRQVPIAGLWRASAAALVEARRRSLAGSREMAQRPL